MNHRWLGTSIPMALLPGIGASKMCIRDRLLTIFATILTILYFFEISVKDIIAYVKNPKDSNNIINKIRIKFGKKAKIDGVDDKTMLNKTCLLYTSSTKSRS